MSEPRLPSRRILIVDDTPATGYLLGRLLESMGQKVKSVHDALSALELMKAETPELVISDLSMPVMDGYEFARRVRAEASFAGVFLVALSGLSSDEDRERANSVGFDRFLVKPVSVPALRDMLASFPDPDAAG